MSSRSAWSGLVCATGLLLGCGGEADPIDETRFGSGGAAGASGSPNGGSSNGGSSNGGVPGSGGSSGGSPSGRALGGGTGGVTPGAGGSAVVCAPNAACNGLDYCEDLCFGEDCCYLSCDCRVDEDTNCAADLGHLCCTMVCK